MSIARYSAVVAAIFPTLVSAGPFGVDVGADINTLDVEELLPKATLRSVPQPHPLFETYSVWQTEKYGVCRILAISKMYQDDAYGRKLRDDMERVELAVAKKYGASRAFDSILPGALWDDARDWVMSIKQNERSYGFDWANVSANEEKYSMIQLWAEALSSDSSIMILEYRADFFDDCAKEIEQAVDQSF